MKIAGTEISDKKHVVISLTEIFGIGKSTAIKILNESNIIHSKKVKDLTDSEKQQLSDVLDKYTIEHDLRRKVLDNINHHVLIRSYRGIRIQKGLPVNGQRTHTNAKSSKRCSPFRTVSQKISNKNGKK